MPDYGDILRFLAQNPPKLEAERRVHASLLELLGACLREEEPDPELADRSGTPATELEVTESRFH